MNIHEAILSGKPFSHPNMVGAYMLLDNELWHRDHIPDYAELVKCSPAQRREFGGGWKLGGIFEWIGVDDLVREDWITHNV